MIVATNLGIGGLAGLALLPLLLYVLYLLVAEWRTVGAGINATRGMMVVWSLTFEFQIVWKLYATWYRTVYDEAVPWVEEGSLATSLLLLACALMSLAAFILRQRGPAAPARKGG